MSVRSSTSSSSGRIPPGPWRRTGLLAAALVLIVLGGWEGYWRARGFRPALRDDNSLWANTRRQVADNDPNEVVLLGASRIQLGTHLDTFAEVWGRRPVQLAMDGCLCLPILEHLARTPGFRGTVIVDVWPTAFFKRDPAPGAAAGAVKTYEKGTFSQALEDRLCLLTQSALVFRLPELAPHQLWKAWNTGKWPNVTYTRLLYDRERRADYTMVKVFDLPLYLPPPGRPPGDPASKSPEQWRADVEQIQQWVAAIQARGGQVVFISLPASGSTRRWEEETWPRWRYWDVLAEYTTAITVHQDDYPELRDWICPDGSHIDYRDAPAFTRAYAGIIRELVSGRTPASYDPPAAQAARINFAARATIAAGTEFIPEHPAEHLLHEPEVGDWSALTVGLNPNTVVVDLGDVRSVKRMDLLHYVWAGKPGWPTDFAWHASADGRAWSTIFDARAPAGRRLLRRHPSALGADLGALSPIRYLRFTFRQAVEDDRMLLRRLLVWSDYVGVERMAPLEVTPVMPASDEPDLARGATARLEPACTPGHELFWALRGRRDANYAELTPGSQSFELDLGWTAAATAVELYTSSTEASFDIAVSGDGTTWVQATGAAAPSEPAAPADAVHALALPASQPVRYVRITPSSRDEALRLFQIKLPRASGAAGTGGISTRGGG